MEKLFQYTGKDLQNITMDEWLTSKSLSLRPIASRWFDEIKNCGDDVQDIFHDGHPIGCVDHAPFAYVDAYSAHINVGFFYGAFLPDRFGLLEGSGKRMRHVKIRPNEPCNESAIAALIEAAYEDIKRRLY
ncbi:DUF1801 domain-containing protein [uncultured Imperialibacter sp.]|uniref:DUF1801 domain-containing protein n=1 Tax=uncultured Imperialibacter sp. TaxID=1672639 RepID=UPI0030DC52B0|tara:strand:+ start:18246 stop:18638 length:393 start_codon:yes stop_codon:yes gene_type:complete